MFLTMAFTTKRLTVINIETQCRNPGRWDYVMSI